MNQRGFFGLSMAQGVVYAVAAIAVVAFLTGLYYAIYNKGHAAGKKLLTDYIENQSKVTRETERVVEKVVKEVEIKYLDRIKVVKEKGDVITKTVTEYVKVADDAACELRAGFVRVHDAAARNQPAEPASESDRAPAGVALSEATTVVTDNYKACYVWREQVLGWQEFWPRYVEAVKTSGCVPK